MRKLWVALWVCVLMAACAPEVVENEGPRLIAEVTVNSSPAAEGTAVAQASNNGVVSELPNPLQQVTLSADFVVVTPTLPPSKTPTQTPTHTLTPTQTMTPTITVTATSTTFLLPTSEIIAITQEAPAPVDRVCDSTWFFIEPRPAGCPLNPPNVGQGVYQTFQNGYMLWVGNQDAIYVLYNDQQSPRWQVFRDYFNEGMPEFAAEYISAPSPGLWQPRRGFGLLWRDNRVIRDRIGWATMEWEMPFSTQVQTGNDGAVYMSRPDGQVFVLIPGGQSWRLSTTAGGGLPAVPPVPQRGPDGFVPLPTPLGN